MTIYSKAPFKHVTEFTNLTTEELFATPEFKAAVATSAGGGLEGTNYIFVAANGTDIENAAELQAAYTTAQGMNPDPNNRITIVAAPGYYNFGSNTFYVVTDYIDIVSLDGNRSIIFNSSNQDGTIYLDFVTDVYLKGIDVQTKKFIFDTYYPGVTVENCKGGDESFSSTFSNMGSKFIDCEGGNNSFGGNTVNTPGTFIRCKAGSNSFGLTASGTFTDCVAGDYSFGGGTGIGTASGTFTNCVSTFRSFGGLTASGTFTNCTAGNDSFGGFTGSGVFRNCIAGSGSLGAVTASGTFTNCTGGNNSFGGFSALTGKLYYCRLTSGTFQTVSGAGITRLCLDGSNAENNQG